MTLNYITNKSQEWQVVKTYLKQLSKGDTMGSLLPIKLDRKFPFVIGEQTYQLGHSFYIVRNCDKEIQAFLLTHRKQSNVAAQRQEGESLDLVDSGKYGSTKIVEDEHGNTYLLKRVNRATEHARMLANEIAVLELQEELIAVGYRAEKDAHYIIMRKAPGRDLQHMLSHRKADNLRKPHFFYGFFYQLAEQLFELHSKGYAHLDLKCENIIYSAKLNAGALVDYGFSEKLGDSTTMRGTSGYVCPEMISVYLLKPLYQLYLEKDKSPTVEAFMIYAFRAKSRLSLLRELAQTIGEQAFTTYIHQFYHAITQDETAFSAIEVTEKMDIFSFGVIIAQVSSTLNIPFELTNSMLSTDPDKRPSALQVIKALESAAQACQSGVSAAICFSKPHYGDYEVKAGVQAGLIGILDKLTSSRGWGDFSYRRNLFYIETTGMPNGILKMQRLLAREGFTKSSLEKIICIAREKSAEKVSRRTEPVAALYKAIAQTNPESRVSLLQLLEQLKQFDETLFSTEAKPEYPPAVISQRLVLDAI